VLECLIEATYTRDRKGELARANLGIEKLRFFFRLAVELHYLDRATHRRAGHGPRCSVIGVVLNRRLATLRTSNGEAARSSYRRHRQLRCAARGGQTRRDGLLSGGGDVVRYCNEVNAREHEADDITREVLTALRRSFIMIAATSRT
jgi:hypothetical protein